MANDNDLLNVHSSPSAAPNTAGRQPSVRRLNRLPVYIVGGILVGFALIIALIAINKGQASRQLAEQVKGEGDSSKLAQNILADAPANGVIGAAPPELPALDLDSLPPNPTLPDDAPMTLPLPQAPMAPDLPDEAQQNRQQMLAAAIKSPTQVQATAGTPSSNFAGAAQAGPTNRDEILAQIQQVQQEADNALNNGNDQAAALNTYNQLNQALGGGGNGVGGIGGNAPVNLNIPPQPAVANNNTAASDNRWQLANRPERAHANALMAGSVIPAIATSGINSDLPGQVMAQVSQNVYDSRTGRRLLIPQGTKLIGSYDNNVSYGQKRLFIAWNRLIFPDGRSLDIGSMPGSNGAGYPGFHDKVNNHYMRIWGNALLLSVIGAGISYGTDRDRHGNNNNTTTFSSELSTSLASTFGQAITQTLQKNLNLSPTLEIRPGYRFNVVVTKDILF